MGRRAESWCGMSELTQRQFEQLCYCASIPICTLHKCKYHLRCIPINTECAVLVDAYETVKKERDEARAKLLVAEAELSATNARLKVTQRDLHISSACLHALAAYIANSHQCDKRAPHLAHYTYWIIKAAWLSQLAIPKDCSECPKDNKVLCSDCETMRLLAEQKKGGAE